MITTTITAKVTLQFDVYGSGKYPELATKVVIEEINKVLQTQFPDNSPQLFETDIEVICIDEVEPEDYA